MPAKLPKGQAAFNKLLSRFQRNARTRDLTFDLTEPQVKFLTKQRCFYCGKPPEQIVDRRTNGDWKHNGLDRLDIDEGYYWGNVVACCKHCNKAKGDRSPEEFIEHCRRVVENS